MKPFHQTSAFEFALPVSNRLPITAGVIRLFHFRNIPLHIINALLLFIVLRKMVDMLCPRALDELSEYKYLVCMFFLYYNTCEWVGRSPAGFGRRKVRAGQGTVVANGHPGRPAGKCHRKYTADDPIWDTGNGEMVR